MAFGKRKRVALLAVVLGVTISRICYVMWPAWDGAWSAHSDLADGQPRYLLYGELAPFEEAAARRLKERHGVALQRVALCVVTTRLVERSDAYNEAVCRELGLPSRIFNEIVQELLEENR